MRDALNNNPLLQAWNTPYGLPPFDRVAAEHFLPAFDVAMQAHLAELDAIADQTELPSFANTLVTFDASGRQLKQIDLLFSNLCSSETSPVLQAVELTMAPRLAAHESAIYMHAGLFQRIDALFRDRAGLGLDAEQSRLLERVHLDFVRAGAQLQGEAKARHATVMAELAEACTRFSQNILADEAAFTLELNGEADLAGLPDFVRASARNAATQRGLSAGSYIITLSPSIAEPFLTFSDRRDLRETIWRERTARGAHAGEHDNRPLAAHIVALRQEQAAILGYDSYADYELVDRMAGKASAVLNLLEQAWQPALQKAEADRAVLNDKAAELGLPTPLAAWDWRYLAEKVRQQRYDLDDAETKPYFTLENMIAAMFDCAGRLFGLKFIEQHNIPLHHPDARLWAVRDRSNGFVGLFIGDNFARPSKRSGAWMSIFRSQSGIAGGTTPIVINNNNFAKADTTLLSFDDVRTLFHEFGHGLHGLLSQVRYERLAGTQVLRDFVELPSQIFENWAKEEAVLRQHARHYQSGAVIPAALLAKLKAASQFNQAWATVQYVAPALIDMALHSLPNGTTVDITAFEAEQCKRLGVPADIGQRHYLSHFSHLFSGPWYAAGYYVYMWAEVLDADGFNAFQEAGDPFEPSTAHRLLQHIYSAGNKQDPAAAYRAFRGRDPQVEPMLKKRGLITV
ncbi:M3 family metallopeptidase [Chitinimonas sp. BJB300]|uniref:M3 family metallopeptidase n=1 Tax=Chitinimonas sp. BJB300 TaxID=1559339 RepID=UPI000C0FA787|nr:M3 family metallopeptidase [Chitinimonas sp. BJB300]PHV11396.1 peptidase M3 [Chitinimonas sp. BJB300]TSJ90994.1 M3 family metallopeptidase [Chitinimonas sp. BJB300]